MSNLHTRWISVAYGLAVAVLLVFGLLLALTLPVSAHAASYIRTDGSIINPIRYTANLGGGIHPYLGNNLGPGANLTGAYLSYANLGGADLYEADLTGANLTGAYLIFSNLTDANLGGANLTGAYLVNSNLAGARYDALTLFPSGNDLYAGSWGLPGNSTPWAFGMVPVPEPVSGLMLTVGCAALAAMARRRSGPPPSRSGSAQGDIMEVSPP